MFPSGAKHHKAALALDDMASALEAGLPLESLGANPALGDQVLLDLVRQRGIELKTPERIALEAGWKSGKGAEALRARAAQRRHQAEFVEATWKGLSYPLTLLGILPLAALATYALIGPGFAIGLAISYAILGAIVLLMARKFGRGDPDLDRYPVIGTILINLRELPYLESLHALYGAGVPLVEAHRDASKAVQARGFRERLGLAQQHLSEGTSLQEALQLSRALSAETLSLLATGEQAGQLEDALSRALTRRREVASQKLSTAAKQVGQIAYGLAVAGVVIIIVKFYSAYFGMMGLG